MPLADPNMFDEAKDLDVPRYGRPDVGHGQHGSHPRVRRGPVHEHEVILLGGARGTQALDQPGGEAVLP